MSLIDIPDGTDIIEVRKKINQLLHNAEREAKPDKCILCGKSKTSFCNSHSVPQMILRNIAVDGELLQASATMDLEIVNLTKGVNNSGTFYIICRDCDSKYFQDYENAENLKKNPTDKILAEIALKDNLIQLSRRRVEIAALSKMSDRIEGFDIFTHRKNLDLKEYEDEISLYKDIIDTDKKGCFHILFCKALPYKVPIAVQTMLALMSDMEGADVNYVFDDSPNIRMQNMHLCVFPLSDCSVVMAFYHKRDRYYKGLLHQFHSVTDGKKLKYLNWLTFKYSENYFLSRKVSQDVISDENLVKLCQENSGAPKMGMLNFDELMKAEEYKSPTMDDIPNLLDQKYAV